MKCYSLKNWDVRSRDDVANALIEMLDHCTSHISNEGTGLSVGRASAHYSNRINLFEGWSRLLWGIVPLLKGGYSWSGWVSHRQGFVNGPNKLSDNYWGDVGDSDQRIVEMAAISLSLLLCPDEYWNSLKSDEQSRLISWLLSCNGKKISDNNWHFFRALVNMAVKILTGEHDEKQMNADLDFIDNLYVSDGWYRDDVPFDYYNAFGIQFYCLIYYKFMKDIDIERCTRYKERLSEFAHQFMAWFSSDGASIPFGRSQTYRFAASSFFAACAFADLELIPWGVMKKIVLSNLRYWFSKPIFDNDGLLTVGYCYPSLLMSEEYNAPGSPYWGFKTFIILALDNNHPFWSAEEQDIPLDSGCIHLPVLKSIIQRTSQGNVCLLSSGQYPAFEMNHAAEKYSKFAYSTDFGFSVSVGSYTPEKLGLDNMLYVSECDNYWRPRRKTDFSYSCDDLLYSVWQPFCDVEIQSWVIPAGDWHLRVHKIKSNRYLDLIEGGFGLMRYNEWDAYEKESVTRSSNDKFIAVQTKWGVTSIEDLTGENIADYVYSMPNTNLVFSTQMVPVVKSSCRKGETKTLCSLVGASLFRAETKSVIDEKPEIEIRGKIDSILINGKEIKLLKREDLQ